MAHYLRLWDVAAASRPDLMIANSNYTRQRIQRYYHRESEVIEPPIDTRRFAEPVPPPGVARSRAGDSEAPFLVVSALVPYKRVELAVRAMAGRPERLVVVGDGPERAALERLAGPNVSFLGWVDDQTLLDLYRGCRALVHPAIDDFGMVVVEALAAGKPVVVSAESGVAALIRAGETGVFIEEPTVDALGAALDRLRLHEHDFDPSCLRETARRYDSETFERRFADAVDRAAHDLGGARSRRALNLRNRNDSYNTSSRIRMA